jgi:uncharacterized small protein (DUF1192 family)
VNSDLWLIAKEIEKGQNEAKRSGHRADHDSIAVTSITTFGPRIVSLKSELYLAKNKGD